MARRNSRSAAARSQSRIQFIVARDMMGHAEAVVDGNRLQCHLLRARVHLAGWSMSQTSPGRKDRRHARQAPSAKSGALTVMSRKHWSAFPMPSALRLVYLGDGFQIGLDDLRRHRPRWGLGPALRRARRISTPWRRMTAIARAASRCVANTADMSQS